jgi:hypothetical protein
MRALVPLFSLTLALAAACGGETAALGQADIAPACSPGDVTCATDGLDAPLALHGSLVLDVDLQVSGSGAPRLALEAVDPTVLAVAGTEITATGAGVSALLLHAEREVVDFTHLFVAAADHVALERADGEDAAPMIGPIELLPGDELTLVPRPYLGALRLLGRSPVEWSVSGDGVALLADGTPERRRLVARAPGTAMIAVEAFGFATELTVEVLP